MLTDEQLRFRLPALTVRRTQLTHCYTQIPNRPLVERCPRIGSRRAPQEQE
jgi:hypothetical protein